MGSIRAERFCDGALLSFFTDGFISKWLKRILDLEMVFSSDDIKEVYLDIGGYPKYDHYRINCNLSKAIKTIINGFEEAVEKVLSIEETDQFLNDFKALHTEYWNHEYIDKDVCDGTEWTLTVNIKGQGNLTWGGIQMFPSNWNELVRLFKLGVEEL